MSSSADEKASTLLKEVNSVYQGHPARKEWNWDYMMVQSDISSSL